MRIKISNTRMYLVGVVILILIFKMACSRTSSNDINLGSLQGDSLDLPYYTLTVDSQVVDLVVNDERRYKQELVPGEQLLIGNELFSYLCSDCHSPNKIFDTTGFYEKQFVLDTILLPSSKNHGQWSNIELARLDSFDVAAIQYYIDRYKRNDVRGMPND